MEGDGRGDTKAIGAARGSRPSSRVPFCEVFFLVHDVEPRETWGLNMPANRGGARGEDVAEKEEGRGEVGVEGAGPDAKGAGGEARSKVPARVVKAQP
jgi:hypothetical protein